MWVLSRVDSPFWCLCQKCGCLGLEHLICLPRYLWCLRFDRLPASKQDHLWVGEKAVKLQTSHSSCFDKLENRKSQSDATDIFVETSSCLSFGFGFSNWLLPWTSCVDVSQQAKQAMGSKNWQFCPFCRWSNNSVHDHCMGTLKPRTLQ